MANIKDIARLAGVSVATVSRVLNDHPYVSEAKRAAVQEVVHRLNYSRNVNAVHLITGKTNMVGVVIPYLNLPYFNSIMEGIAQEALEANVHLLVSQTNYAADKETELLNMLKIKQIDGLLICSRSLEWEVIEAYSQFGPIIACEYIESDRISSVHIDHYGSFRLAMQLLLEKDTPASATVWGGGTALTAGTGGVPFPTPSLRRVFPSGRSGCSTRSTPSKTERR